MSYDVDVFSAEKPIAPASQEGPGWQIAVHGPLDVEADDVPAQARAIVPGLRFLTQFHLEGGATSSAKQKLLTMARALARSARGIVVDQQQGTVETPRGVQRLQIEPHATVGGVLQLSWFVDDVAPLVRALPTEMLEIFQRTIPEVLPRRYGQWEPPQFKLETNGLDHLRQFLHEHVRDMVVWECHKPCRHVFVEVPDRVGATPRGFRSGRMTLNIDSKAGGDHAWRVELTRLWLAVADLIQPFYAEIRMGECPTKSWWWNGIPAASPSAVLIGKPYAALWPAFVSAARSSSAALYYLEQFVESAAGSAANRIPSPPANIASPPAPAVQSIFDPTRPEDLAALLTPPKTKYPDVWPFDGPFS